MAPANLPVWKVGSIPLNIRVAERKSGLDVTLEKRVRSSPTMSIVGASVIVVAVATVAIAGSRHRVTPRARRVAERASAR
jgi:hypothetical protein